MVKKTRKFKVFSPENVESITAKKLQEKENNKTKSGSTSGSERKSREPQSKKSGSSGSSATPETISTEEKPTDDRNEVETQITPHEEPSSLDIEQTDKHVDSPNGNRHAIVQNNDTAESVDIEASEPNLATFAQDFTIVEESSIINKPNIEPNIVYNTLEDTTMEEESSNTGFTTMDPTRRDVKVSKPQPDNPEWISGTCSPPTMVHPFSCLNPHATEFRPGGLGTLEHTQSKVLNRVENTNIASPFTPPNQTTHHLPPGIMLQSANTSFVTQNFQSPAQICESSMQEELVVENLAVEAFPKAPIHDSKSSISPAQSVPRGGDYNQAEQEKEEPLYSLEHDCNIEKSVSPENKNPTTPFPQQIMYGSGQSTSNTDSDKNLNAIHQLSSDNTPIEPVASNVDVKSPTNNWSDDEYTESPPYPMSNEGPSCPSNSRSTNKHDFINKNNDKPRNYPDRRESRGGRNNESYPHHNNYVGGENSKGNSAEFQKRREKSPDRVDRNQRDDISKTSDRGRHYQDRGGNRGGRNRQHKEHERDNEGYRSSATEKMHPKPSYHEDGVREENSGESLINSEKFQEQRGDSRERVDRNQRDFINKKNNRGRSYQDRRDNRGGRTQHWGDKEHGKDNQSRSSAEKMPLKASYHDDGEEENPGENSKNSEEIQQRREDSRERSEKNDNFNKSRHYTRGGSFNNHRNTSEQTRRGTGQRQNSYDNRGRRGHDNRDYQPHGHSKPFYKDQQREHFQKQHDASFKNDDIKYNFADNDESSSTAQTSEAKRPYEHPSQSDTSWRDRSNDESSKYRDNNKFSNFGNQRYGGDNRPRGNSRGGNNADFRKERNPSRGSGGGRFNSNRSYHNKDDIRQSREEVTDVVNDDWTENNVEVVKTSPEDNWETSPGDDWGKSDVSQTTACDPDWNASVDDAIRAPRTRDNSRGGSNVNFRKEHKPNLERERGSGRGRHNPNRSYKDDVRQSPEKATDKVNDESDKRRVTDESCSDVPKKNVDLVTTSPENNWDTNQGDNRGKSDVSQTTAGDPHWNASVDDAIQAPKTRDNSRGGSNVNFRKGRNPNLERERGSGRGGDNLNRSYKDDVRQSPEEATDKVNDDSDKRRVPDESCSDVPKKNVDLVTTSPEDSLETNPGDNWEKSGQNTTFSEDWNASVDDAIEATSKQDDWNTLQEAEDDKLKNQSFVENTSVEKDTSVMPKTTRWDHPPREHDNTSLSRHSSYRNNGRREPPEHERNWRKSYDVPKGRDPRIERDNLNKSLDSANLSREAGRAAGSSGSGRWDPHSRVSWSGQDTVKEKSDHEFDRWEMAWEKIKDFHVVQEIQGDLFEQPKDFSLAHCVAEDLRMGSGIAVDFKRQFKNLPDLLDQRAKQGGLATIEVDTKRFVYYLVTKRESTGKPTYQTLWRSLNKMKAHIKENEVKKLAIPRLGCGLDRLEWSKVKSMIEHLFADVGVAITVCNFQQDEDTPKKSTTCKFVVEEYPITKIASGTLIFYFTTESGDVDKNMQEMSKKFNYLTKFKSYKPKNVGEVVYSEDGGYGLCGCIIRKNVKEQLSFKSLFKCVQEFNKINRKFGKDSFDYVAFQWVNERDYFDDSINQKIITVLTNHLWKVEVYVCRGSFEDSTGE